MLSLQLQLQLPHDAIAKRSDLRYTAFIYVCLSGSHSKPLNM